MPEIQKIVSEINGLSRESSDWQEIYGILVKAKSMRFPVFSVIKLLHTQFRLKSRPSVNLGDDGWIFCDEDYELTEVSISPERDKKPDTKPQDINKTSGNNKKEDAKKKELKSDKVTKERVKPDEEQYKRRKRIIFTFLTVLIVIIVLVFSISSNPNSSGRRGFGTFIGKIFGVNHSPDKPALISPLLGTSDITVSPQLNWSCGDPDGDPLTFDVYVWENGSAVKLEASGLTERSMVETGLKNGSTYLWQVVAKDNHGNTTTGEVWSFKTVMIINRPPALPSLPYPADQERIISASPTLTWNCYDPDGDMMTYNVYFGTINPPTELISSGKSDLTLPVIGLTHGTSYFWKVDALDNHNNITTGTVWSFSTAELYSTSIETINDDMGNPVQYEKKITDSSTGMLNVNACKQCFVALIYNVEISGWWDKWMEYKNENITTPHTFYNLSPGKYTLIVSDPSGSINSGSNGIIIEAIEISGGTELIFNLKQEDFRNWECGLSCPWVYLFSGKDYIKQSEILRDFLGKDNQSEDTIVINSPYVSNGLFRIMLSEEKDEITYLRKISLSVNGEVCYPKIRSKNNAELKLDGTPLVMKKGEIIYFEFDLKKYQNVNGPFILKAEGYFDADPEVIKKQLKHHLK